MNSVSASDPGRLSDTGLVGAAKHAVQGTLRALHLSLFRRPLPRRVALYFHEIDVATAAALNEIIPFFKRRGYSFVKAREYDDDANPERRMIFLSFDDNYLGWHEHLPLFAKHGVNVAFYCNSLPLDAPQMTRWWRTTIDDWAVPRTAVRCVARTCETWPRRGMISVVTAIHTSTSRHWKHQSWSRNSG